MSCAQDLISFTGRESNTEDRTLNVQLTAIGSQTGLYLENISSCCKLQYFGVAHWLSMLRHASKTFVIIATTDVIHSGGKRWIK